MGLTDEPERLAKAVKSGKIIAMKRLPWWCDKCREKTITKIELETVPPTPSGYRKRLEDLSKNLTPLESKVLSLFLKDMKYADIAAELNKTRRKHKVSPSSVDNALCRAKKKMMEMHEGAGEEMLRASCKKCGEAVMVAMTPLEKS